ncbi:MAG: hypothetical protein U0795_15570 [Pirellulales bacterium]
MINSSVLPGPFGATTGILLGELDEVISVAEWPEADVGRDDHST